MSTEPIHINTNDENFKGYLQVIEEVPEFAAQTPEMKALIAESMRRARLQGKLEEEFKHQGSVPRRWFVTAIVVAVTLTVILQKCTHA